MLVLLWFEPSKSTVHDIFVNFKINVLNGKIIT